MRTIALVTAVVFFALQLLGGGPVSVSAQEPGEEAGLLPAVVSGNSEFAFDMYKTLSAVDEGKNILFSPLSISTALSMTYAGARGNTEKQIAEVMHFDLPQVDQHAAFALLSKKLQAPDAKGYQLKVANSLWGQRDFPFTADFLALIEKHYDGGFNVVDFAGDTEGSRQIINRWVEQNTADKIKDLLQKDNLSSLTRLVLTNAVYFKGDWAAKFKPEQTRTAQFYVKPDQTVDVQMMHQTGRFQYAATDGVQILEMPYAGDDLSMVVLLPETGIKEFSAKVGPDQLNEWLGRMSERQVSVFLPKFKFEARYGLGNLLSDMGMQDAFNLPPADFSGMTGGKHLYITAVIHQAVIEVNEEGSEAAAATAVVMGIKSILPRFDEFRADRPFVFLIRHKPTGTILFMGQVANPACK